MGLNVFHREYRVPVLSYFLFLITVFVLKHLLNAGTVFSISAALMLLIPFLLKTDRNYFYFNKEGFAKGALISIFVLAVYVAVMLAHGFFTGRQPGLRETGATFFIVQLLLVAIPEEVFFRGYLQKEFGNDLRAVILVSILFAIAHLVIVCATSGSAGICIQNGLTFFPSLVMGYLYLKTKTLWSSIFFHFFANIVHILLKFN